MSGGAGFLPSTAFPYFWDSHIHEMEVVKHLHESWDGTSSSTEAFSPGSTGSTTCWSTTCSSPCAGSFMLFRPPHWFFHGLGWVLPKKTGSNSGNQVTFGVSLKRNEQKSNKKLKVKPPIFKSWGIQSESENPHFGFSELPRVPRYGIKNSTQCSGPIPKVNGVMFKTSLASKIWGCLFFCTNKKNQQLLKNYGGLVIQSDLFGMVKWPF